MKKTIKNVSLVVMLVWMLCAAVGGFLLITSVEVPYLSDALAHGDVMMLIGFITWATLKITSK